MSRIDFRRTVSVNLNAACVIASLVTCSVALASPPRYRATVLPQVDPAAEAPLTTANGLNNLGDVVGAYGTPDQGFLWSASKGVARFSELFGWKSSIGLEINDAGSFVGLYRPDGGASKPFVATLEGGFSTLPPLVNQANVSAAATGISENGLVAGYCATEPDSIFGAPTRAAFWRSGALTDIGTLGGPVSSAAAVNNAGTVVGYSNEPGVQAVRAFRWSESAGLLGLPRWQDGFVTMATDINEAGYIVGAAEAVLKTGLTHSAAVWTPAGVLQTFPHAFPPVEGIPSFAEAAAVNEQLQVVGSELDSGPFELHAMLWQGGRPYVLATRIVDLPAGLRLSNAYDINDNGQILAWGFDSETVQFVGVLLTPGACPADFDADGFLTGIDFDSYVAAFEAGEPSADFDDDGFVTGIDFDAFVTAFEDGCE